MPTASEQIVLGRDQVLTLDGVALEGVREVDVDIDTTAIDVTPWNHNWRSHLPIVGDGTIRVLIYWISTWEAVAAKLLKTPPEPMTLAVSNAFAWRVLPVNVRAQQPITGVQAWEVTFKPYWF